MNEWPREWPFWALLQEERVGLDHPASNIHWICISAQVGIFHVSMRMLEGKPQDEAMRIALLYLMLAQTGYQFVLLALRDGPAFMTS